MPIPNQTKTVEIGHIIVIDIEYEGRLRTRAIQIGNAPNLQARPQTHDASSYFVTPFLGKKRGTKAVIGGSRDSQEIEYPTTLRDILLPGEPISPELMDSFEFSRAAA